MRPEVARKKVNNVKKSAGDAILGSNSEKTEQRFKGHARSAIRHFG
jgi:hypothetical protein